MFDSFYYPKPRPAYFQTPPDTSKIYLHSGENQQDFNTVATFINYFQEMLKFFPKFEQKGYETGAEGELTQAGFGMYTDPKERGLKYSGKIDERYGDWHHAELEQGKYWGYGISETGSNLNWDPAAADSNMFKDLKLNGIDNPLKTADYAKLIAWKLEDVGKFQSYSPSELTAAKQYMQSIAGNASYYDFVMKGIDRIKFANDSDGKFVHDEDPNPDISTCDFMWNKTGVANAEGVSGKGAYYVMLNLLESRRRIYYAASNVFGQHQNIGNSLEMINNIDDFFDKKVGGADPHNFRMFYTYFAMQHSFRSAAQAFSGNEKIMGDLGGPGFIYTAKDRAGFDAFGHWLTGNVENYIGTLSKDEAKRVRYLLDEYKLNNEENVKTTGGEDLNLPYGSTQWAFDKHQDLRYTGWDSFYGNFDNKDPNDLPEYLSPYAVEKGGDHPNYAVAQLLGISDRQIKGLEMVNNNGKITNLYQTNWVAHLVSRFLEAKDYDVMKGVQALSVTNFENIRYQKESREYDKKKADFEDKKREDKTELAVEEAKNNAKADQRRRENEQISRQKRAERATEDQKAEAKRKLMMQIFNQMFENSKKKEK